MKVVSIVLLFFLMCFVSCDSFKNPEIQKIKVEVERQNREKEEIRGHAVKKAMELFQIEDKDGLEKFFYTHEVAVFKDKRTGICLPMLFQKKSKEWETYGFIKGSVLYIKEVPHTFGDYINHGNLETLVEKHCDVDAKYLKHKKNLLEKEKKEQLNKNKNDTKPKDLLKLLNNRGIGDGSVDNFEQLKYWRQQESIKNLPLTKWSNMSKKPMDLKAAKKYCKNLIEQGHSDWRIPRLGELRSLIVNCFETQTLGPCRMRDYALNNYIFRFTESFGGPIPFGFMCIDNSTCGCSCYDYHCKGCPPAKDGRYSRFGDVAALHSLNGTIDFENAKLLRPAIDEEIPLTFVRCIRGETSLEPDLNFDTTENDENSGE